MESFIKLFAHGGSLSATKGIGPRLPGLIYLLFSSLFLVPLLQVPTNVFTGLTIGGIMGQPQEAKLIILSPTLTLPPSPPIPPTPTTTAPDLSVPPKQTKGGCTFIVLAGAVVGIGLVVAKGGGRGNPPRRPIGLLATQRRKKALRRARRGQDNEGGGEPPDQDPPPPPPPGPGTDEVGKPVRPPDPPDIRYFVILLAVYLAIMAMLSVTFPQESARAARNIGRAFRNAWAYHNDRKLQQRLRKTLVRWLRITHTPMVVPSIRDDAVARAIIMEQRWNLQEQWIFLATLVLAGIGIWYTRRGLERQTVGALNSTRTVDAGPSVANEDPAIVEWPVADDNTELPFVNSGDSTKEADAIVNGPDIMIQMEIPRVSVEAEGWRLETLMGEMNKEAWFGLPEPALVDVGVVKIGSDGDEENVEADITVVDNRCDGIEMEHIVVETSMEGVGSVEFYGPPASALVAPGGEEEIVVDEDGTKEEKASFEATPLSTPERLDAESTTLPTEDTHTSPEASLRTPLGTATAHTFALSTECTSVDEMNDEIESPDEIRRRKLNAEGKRPQTAAEVDWPASTKSCEHLFEPSASAASLGVDIHLAGVDADEAYARALAESDDFIDTQLYQRLYAGAPVASSSRLPAVTPPLLLHHTDLDNLWLSDSEVQNDVPQSVDRQDAHDSNYQRSIDPHTKSEETSHGPNRIQGEEKIIETVIDDSVQCVAAEKPLAQDFPVPMEIEPSLSPSTPAPLRKFNPSATPFLPSTGRTLPKSLLSLPFWAPNTRPAPVLKPPPTAEEKKAAKMARRAARRAESLLSGETSGSGFKISSPMDRMDLDRSWLSESNAVKTIVNPLRKTPAQDLLVRVNSEHLLSPLTPTPLHKFNPLTPPFLPSTKETAKWDHNATPATAIKPPLTEEGNKAANLSRCAAPQLVDDALGSGSSLDINPFMVGPLSKYSGSLFQSEMAQMEVESRDLKETTEELESRFDEKGASEASRKPPATSFQLNPSAIPFFPPIRPIRVEHKGPGFWSPLRKNPIPIASPLNKKDRRWLRALAPKGSIPPDG